MNLDYGSVKASEGIENNPVPGSTGITSGKL